LNRFVTPESAREYILTVNHFSTTQQCRSQPICHRNEIIVRYLGSVQINHTIIKIDIRPFQDACLIDPETTINQIKDSPELRSVQPPELGKVVQFQEVGGLHHHYERVAA
jgi:hypothetical protein